MTARDRLVLIVIAAVAVLGAGYMLGVKPAGEQASKVEAEVGTARSQLEAAKGEVANARSAEQRYRAAYASVATLGIAVPTSNEIASLMYTLDHVSGSKKVEFLSISGGGSSSASAASSSSPSSSARSTAGVEQLPFSFTFQGSYKSLIDFLKQLEGFTVQSPSGTLQVSGRLLTIQSIAFGSAASGSSGSSQSGSSSGAQPSEMTWAISATAYMLPAASTASAVPASTSSGSQPTSSGSGSGSSAATPAVVRATP